MNKLVNNQVSCLPGEIWLCKIDNNNSINPHPVIILKNIYNYWYDALQLSTSYYKIKKSKWLIKLNKSNGLRKESYACVSELITIDNRNINVLIKKLGNIDMNTFDVILCRAKDYEINFYKKELCGENAVWGE